MEAAEREKLREIVFERIVSGEALEQLHNQLLSQVSAEEAESFIADARDRIERGRGSETFARAVRKIRERRLVGARYIVWQVIAGISIVLAALSMLGAILIDGKIGGSFWRLVIGGVILAAVEWRAHLRLQVSSSSVLDD